MKRLLPLIFAASLLANVAFFTGTLRSPMAAAGAAAPTAGTCGTAATAVPRGLAQISALCRKYSV